MKKYVVPENRELVICRRHLKDGSVTVAIFQDGIFLGYKRIFKIEKVTVPVLRHKAKGKFLRERGLEIKRGKLIKKEV